MCSHVGLYIAMYAYVFCPINYPILDNTNHYMMNTPSMYQDGGDGGWMALIINMLVGVFVNKRKTRLNPRFRDKGPNVKVGKV